jgi:glycosidase
MTLRCRAFGAALVLALWSATGPSQTMNVVKVEPPNWWNGMAMKQVQLMVYGDNLAGITARSQSPQIKVLRVYRTPNPSYAFIDIEIAPDAFEGFHRLMLNKGGDSVVLNYPVLRRKNTAGRFRGFDQNDIIYLITPDRFANGDTTNDNVEGYPDRRDRNSGLGRHGGDLRGIVGRLDYVKDLGVTTLWINPLVENNMTWASYHGYAATDLYRIDPRFGDNAQYVDLVHEAHHRGLKVIMDHVSNHIGINHPWLKNLPSADWLNGSVGNHVRATHSKAELTDVHGDSSSRMSATLGWFADIMPDLNQRTSFVGRYLIQNTLWWIETTGIDGIREDTYPYADGRYLAEWARAIRAQYPFFNIVGEIWVGDPAFLSPYQEGSPINRGFDTRLPSVTDFALYDAFTGVFGNKGSIRLIYDCLTRDHLYRNPAALMTFVDNHDVRRILHQAGGDAARVRLALTILLTTRGIPQLYYGTEIGMMGGKDHGSIRGDFPGGFPGDSTNAFAPDGRSPREEEMFSFTKSLLRLRKERPSLRSGRLIHFSPVNEAYVYFRILPGEKSMIIANNREESQKVGLAPFRLQLAGAATLRNLETGVITPLESTTEIDVGGNEAVILAVE